MFRERGWVIFNQPSQSPVTNVHDACIFPMLSKYVSTQQALEYGSVLLKGEELYSTVKAVWDDPRHCIAMSRAFAGHWQIVCSILTHEGDNNYLSDRGGLSFGVRKMFVADAEGIGVVPVNLAPTHEGETTQGEFLNERAVRKLKYEEPALSALDKAMLDRDMIHVLNDLVDDSEMSAEMREMWNSIRYELDTDSDEESVESEIYEAQVEQTDDGEDTESDSDSDVDMLEGSFE